MYALYLCPRILRRTGIENLHMLTFNIYESYMSCNVALTLHAQNFKSTGSVVLAYISFHFCDLRININYILLLQVAQKTPIFTSVINTHIFVFH